MGTKRTLTPRRNASGRATVKDLNAFSAGAEKQAATYGSCRVAIERFRQLGWDVTSADSWWRLYGPPELAEEPSYEEGSDDWQSAIVAHEAFRDARKAWLVASGHETPKRARPAHPITTSEGAT